MIELKRQSFTTDSVNKENIMELFYAILFIVGAILLTTLLLYLLADIMIEMFIMLQARMDKWQSNKWKRKVGLKRRK